MSLTFLIELGIGEQKEFFKFLSKEYKILSQESLSNGGVYRISSERTTREKVLDDLKKAPFYYEFRGFLPETI